MSVNIEIVCNFCKKEVEEGETYLHLFGRYEKKRPMFTKKDYTEKIIVKDNLRPFLVACDSCRNDLLRYSHKDKKISFTFEDIKDNDED